MHKEELSDYILEVIRLRIRIQEFFWRILRHRDTGHFSTILLISPERVTRLFITNLSLDMKVPVNFEGNSFPVSGSRVCIPIRTSDPDHILFGGRLLFLTALVTVTVSASPNVSTNKGDKAGISFPCMFKKFSFVNRSPTLLSRCLC